MRTNKKLRRVWNARFSILSAATSTVAGSAMSLFGDGITRNALLGMGVSLGAAIAWDAWQVWQNGKLANAD